MLPQEHLIARVREVCAADERLVAALTYGSFAQGVGDVHSDIEYWLFFRSESVATLDKAAWLADVAPFRYSVVNEFGSQVVFYPGVIRGEFHFATGDDIASVATWPALSAPIDRMIVLDRTGELRRALSTLPASPHLPTGSAEIDELCGRFANWLVLAQHVACRGELLRAVDALGHARRHLLWMARLAEDQTGTWLTPSRRAETDLSVETISDLVATTSTASPGAVSQAIAATWSSGRAHWLHLAAREGFEVPAGLFADLDSVLLRG
ncbi:MAG: hypothetical protein HOV79_15110 [Hamadaea sp.]|nr:hypothetical protein [Hamadaea sp.]